MVSFSSGPGLRPGVDTCSSSIFKKYQAAALGNMSFSKKLTRRAWGSLTASLHFGPGPGLFNIYHEAELGGYKTESELIKLLYFLVNYSLINISNCESSESS